MPTFEGEVVTFNPVGPLNVRIPLLAIGGAGASLRVFDNNIDQPLGLVYIQNLSVNPVKVTINDAGEAAKFHFVLAGGTVVDDGNGGGVEIDLFKLGVKTIDLFHETNAIRCAVRKYLKSR